MKTFTNYFIFCYLSVLGKYYIQKLCRFKITIDCVYTYINERGQWIIGYIEKKSLMRGELYFLSIDSKNAYLTNIQKLKDQ